jgi:hypothetical protein
MSATPSSLHRSHRTRPPQKLAWPLLPQPMRSAPLENVQASQRYSTTDPTLSSFSSLKMTSTPRRFCRRTRGDPAGTARGFGGGLGQSRHSSGPKLARPDPACELVSGRSNEIARGAAARHPSHDLHFGTVDERPDYYGPLLVDERCSVLPPTRAVDEHLAADGENGAGVVGRARASRASCREGHTKTA